MLFRSNLVKAAIQADTEMCQIVLKTPVATEHVPFPIYITITSYTGSFMIRVEVSDVL